ncbi:hypothetical protein COOONC_08911 [Cooperia oncophora]
MERLVRCHTTISHSAAEVPSPSTMRRRTRRGFTASIAVHKFNDSEVAEFSEQKEGEVTEEVGAETTPTTKATAGAEGSTTGVPQEKEEPVGVLRNRTRDENASHFQKGCAIKFQARPLSERPPEFHAQFEVELKVDSVEMCATRCYQVGSLIIIFLRGEPLSRRQ